MSTVDEDGIYAGPACLIIHEVRHAVRVRLKGSVNPFDGYFHWQGTVYDAPEHMRPTGSQIRLGIDDTEAPARLVERTADGHLMISGTGRPPFRP